MGVINKINKPISVYIKEDELRQIQKASEKEYMSISSYVKKCALVEAKKLENNF